MPAGPLTSSALVHPAVPFIQTNLTDGKVQIECPPGDPMAGVFYAPFGKLGSAGPLALGDSLDKFICDPSIGKFFSLISSKELHLTTLSCVIPKMAIDFYCTITIDGSSYSIIDLPATIFLGSVCPAGHTPQTEQGAPMPSLSCEVGGKKQFTATYSNGTKAPYTDPANFKCVNIMGKCVLPPAPSSAPFTNPLVPYTSSFLPGGKVQIECPNEYMAYGNLGPSGPLIAIDAIGGSTAFVCDPAVGKFFDISSSPPKELFLKTMSCADVQLVTEAVMNHCDIAVSGIYYKVYDFPGTIGPEYFPPCPSGSSLKDIDGEPMPKLSCEIGGQHKFFATYQNGTKAPIFPYHPFFKCVADPTTTTTSTTSTTTEATTTTSPTTTSEPIKVEHDFLLKDIVNIITGSNITRSGPTYPYFFKVIEEIEPMLPFNATTTIHYAKLVLTECKRAQDEEKIKKNNDDCLPRKINGTEVNECLVVRRYGVGLNIRYNSTTFNCTHRPVPQE